jgi:hypothetical protein
MTHYTSDNPSHIGTVVFLDGTEVQDVIECDTTEGWVIRTMRNDDGYLCLVGDDVATEKVFGTVTVKEPKVNQ